MRPIGYLELIARFALDALAPEVSSYALEKGHRRSSDEDGRRAEYYPRTAAPGDEWTDHLVFALKHEGVNLEVLSALWGRVPEGDLTAFVERSPTGRYARVAWFLFEWLTGRCLPVPDLTQGNYVPVLDPARYVAADLSGDAMRVRRQRVLNNLPGTPAYCPLVRRTAGLEAAIAERLESRVREVLSRFPEEVVFRATQYLFVKETKSSYEIEHLRPDQRRTARFVELLRRAGNVACETEQELAALQRLIVDQRYAAQGFRDSQNYVGQNLGPGRELVHFVPPKPEDLRPLMEGWEICCRRLLPGRVHPVIAAAMAGFGFVFLHPFEDGNGRLHRFLIHHQLAAGGFTPEGVVFPVSAVMLRDMRRYDAVLESYSRDVMRHVEYRLDREGLLHVLNDTARFYRYPDLTRVAEQLFAFIRDTIDREFTVELQYLTVFDEARRRIAEIVDMPDQRLDLFIRLCLQGGGKLSPAKRGRFSELTDAEIARMEAVVVGARDRTRLEKG